jgi:CheY-like chemotaxis protein
MCGRHEVRGKREIPMQRFLVIEDDRQIQKALKRLFESEGDTVEIA